MVEELWNRPPLMPYWPLFSQAHQSQFTRVYFLTKLGSNQAMMMNKTYPKCINFSDDHSVLDEMKKIIPEESKQLIKSTHAAKFLADRSR